ncbi:MAG: LuxR C-terminal-related transcriptional regulator, partial [Chloroflexota bacterium]|nr:LuxR C-terminal-related transcriptional regulator [Chloroflexota bacterium]
TNQLRAADETYRRVLQLMGDPPLPVAGEAHLGVARIAYEWNDLDTAEQHGQQGLHLARQFDQVIDRFVIYEVFLARVRLAQGDVAGATALLAKAGESARLHNFVHRIPEVAEAQVLAWLRQGDLVAAAELAGSHDLPFSQARVQLARGDPSAALALLGPVRQRADAEGWEDERLRVMVLQAVAHRSHSDKVGAMRVLGAALALAEPGGFIRLFLDEDPPMAELLLEAAALGIMPGYIGKLLAALETEPSASAPVPLSPAPSPERPLIEPLSERELEVLRLFRTELSGPEIANALVVALSTVRTHTKSIYSKLGVNSRRAAVNRAEDLGLM